jgi:hypothetical protein
LVCPEPLTVKSLPAVDDHVEHDQPDEKYYLYTANYVFDPAILAGGEQVHEEKDEKEYCHPYGRAGTDSGRPFKTRVRVSNILKVALFKLEAEDFCYGEDFSRGNCHPSKPYAVSESLWGNLTHLPCNPTRCETNRLVNETADELKNWTLYRKQSSHLPKGSHDRPMNSSAPPSGYPMQLN